MVDIRREISRRGAFGGHHERFATVKLNEAMQGCHHISKLKESSVLFRISGGRASTRNMVLQSDIDLLHPPAELEKRSHKLKRLVQSPNSFFMDVKCQGCFQICFNEPSVLQYHSLLSLSERGNVRLMLDHALHTDGRQSSVDGRLLIPREERVDNPQTGYSILSLASTWHYRPAFQVSISANASRRWCAG